MDDINGNKQIRLDVLISHLESFPVQELIVASGDLRRPKVFDEETKKWVYQSLAGAHAIGRISSYMHMLREANKKRQLYGQQAHMLLERAQQLRETDPESAITADVEAVFLSGLQEVTFHFFVSCVIAIDGLLPLVAKSTSYKIPPKDKAVLESYKPLRDYFEHMENRAPGKSHQGEVLKESHSEYEWRIVSGFATDEKDRIILNGRPIDVTTRGLTAVEDVIARCYIAMKASCLNQVREHFLNDPDSIPTPDQVPYRPLISIYSASDAG